MYEKAWSLRRLTAFLRSRAQHDQRIAARNDMAEPIPWRDSRVLDRLSNRRRDRRSGIIGENDVYLRHADRDRGVPADDSRDAAGDGAVPEYVKVNWTKGVVGFRQLINDDFVEAIRLLLLAGVLRRPRGGAAVAGAVRAAGDPVGALHRAVRARLLYR